MAGEEYVTIDFHGDVTLKVSEVWPNGDAPAVITAEAVKVLMESCGRKATVLKEWDLTEHVQVTVTVSNPHCRQDTALFPDQASPRFLTAEVWP